MEDRFVRLETKVSYQERLLDELNGVITTQQKQLDELERQLRVLQEQVLSGAEPTGPHAERPPHY